MPYLESEKKKKRSNSIYKVSEAIRTTVYSVVVNGRAGNKKGSIIILRRGTKKADFSDGINIQL